MLKPNIILKRKTVHKRMWSEDLELRGAKDDVEFEVVGFFFILPFSQINKEGDLSDDHHLVVGIREKAGDLIWGKLWMCRLILYDCSQSPFGTEQIKSKE